jgi:bifunctional NMN adenylyltransferase/nudix hydrolase
MPDTENTITMQHPVPVSSQPPTSTAARVAVVIGRWQLVHKGHESLLTTALALADQVVIVIGSAFRARDTRNPFTWQERQAMLLASLSAADKARVHCVPVRDYFDDARWNAAVLAGVKQFTDQSQAQVTLVGFSKDHTSYYLHHFPQWALHEVAPSVEIDATALRHVFFDGVVPDARWAVLEPYVSPAVLHYLQAWSQLPVYAQRAVEHAAVVRYRQRWTADCYLTADAVVLAQEHVLLIRRGGDVGHGQWALPGGFVEKNETFYQAAVRELAEETGFKTWAATLQHACKGRAVFDHPLRSPRGRLVTQAFFFDMGNIRLPEIAGADDALEARWVPCADLPALEAQLFEDHAAILDHFLGLYP